MDCVVAYTEESVHALQTPWSFWYSKKTSGSSASAEGFSSSLKHLGTFKSIEGFVEYVCSVSAPSLSLTRALELRSNETTLLAITVTTHT